VKLLQNNAPAHRIIACAGAFVLWAQLVSCDRAAPKLASGDRSFELAGGTVHLESGVAMHDVRVHASRNADFIPAQETLDDDDVVRFTSDDTRTHALIIRAPTPEAQQQLDSSGQMRSPPLVSRGQAWIVSFKGLPAGTYTVSCISHAGTATLVVR
jgi:plastocyanin